MLAFSSIFLLLLLLLSPISNGYPQQQHQFPGGIQQPMIGMAMDSGQSSPIMPINGGSFPYSPQGIQPQYQQQLAAALQQQFLQQQISRRYGMQPQQQHQPDPFQQQQQLLQMYQQHRLQQIQPVGGFHPSASPINPGFLPAHPQSYNPGYGPIQPVPNQHLQQNQQSSISPANIPMQIVIGRQVPSGPQSAQEHQNPAAFGSTLATAGASAAFQAEEPPAPPAQSSSANSELPKFLQSAPQEMVDEFKRIIRQPNSSYAEQVKQIDVMVAKLDKEHQELYKQFMHENDDREQQHRDRIHATVAKMSDKAQEQFAKISAVLRNPSVPDQERWDRVLNLYGKMEPDLRNEFEQKFKGFAQTPTNYFI